MKKNYFRTTGWQIFFIAEFIALIISVAITVTPGKFSSSNGFGYLFFENPGFFESLFINFLATNVLLVIVGLIIIYLTKRDINKSKKKSI